MCHEFIGDIKYFSPTSVAISMLRDMCFMRKAGWLSKLTYPKPFDTSYQFELILISIFFFFCIINLLQVAELKLNKVLLRVLQEFYILKP